MNYGTYKKSRWGYYWMKENNTLWRYLSVCGLNSTLSNVFDSKLHVLNHLIFEFNKNTSIIKW